MDKLEIVQMKTYYFIGVVSICIASPNDILIFSPLGTPLLGKSVPLKKGILICHTLLIDDRSGD